MSKGDKLGEGAKAQTLQGDPSRSCPSFVTTPIPLLCKHRSIVQVNVQNPEKVDAWRWRRPDLEFLLHQFKGLRVTQQYRLTQQQLAALGPQGKAPLAQVEMEMLGKVVDDFLAQLAAQLSRSPRTADSAACVDQSEGLSDKAPGMTSGESGSPGADTRTAEEGMGQRVTDPAQGGVAPTERTGVKKGQRKNPIKSQVQKKKGLQKQRLQLKAGKHGR